MRDLLILIIVVSGGLIALRHPFVGAMLWTWLSIMNPHRLAWGFIVNAPVALFAALCTLIGLLATKEKRSPLIGSPVIWLILLMIWMGITTAFAFNLQGSLNTFEKVIKIDGMVLVVLMLVRTRREMQIFAWLLAFSVAFFGIKGGLFTLLTGGNFRVYGPSGSYIEENNALALALIITIPLLRFLQTTLQQAWQKHLMTVIMLLCGISALGSHSRGALLAITAMLGLLWWRGKNKFSTALLIAVVGFFVLSFMPEHWWARMGTIETYQQDQSAMGRLNAWWMAWHLAQDRFFGGGFSIYNAYIYGIYAPDPTFVVSSHSIYFTMLGEHGFVGLFLYLALWISTWRSAAWLRRNTRAYPEAAWCAEFGAMAQVSLVGFAIGGAFLSLAYFDYPYNLMALVVAARYWVENKGWEREPEPEPEPMKKLFGIPLFLGDRLSSTKQKKS